MSEIENVTEKTTDNKYVYNIFKYRDLECRLNDVTGTMKAYVNVDGTKLIHFLVGLCHGSKSDFYEVDGLKLSLGQCYDQEQKEVLGCWVEWNYSEREVAPSLEDMKNDCKKVIDKLFEMMALPPESAKAIAAPSADKELEEKIKKLEALNAEYERSKPRTETESGPKYEPIYTASEPEADELKNLPLISKHDEKIDTASKVIATIIASCVFVAAIAWFINMFG